MQMRFPLSAKTTGQKHKTGALISLHLCAAQEPDNRAVFDKKARNISKLSETSGLPYRSKELP